MAILITIIIKGQKFLLLNQNSLIQENNTQFLFSLAGTRKNIHFSICKNIKWEFHCTICVSRRNWFISKCSNLLPHYGGVQSVTYLCSLHSLTATLVVHDWEEEIQRIYFHNQFGHMMLSYCLPSAASRRKLELQRISNG